MKVADGLQIALIAVNQIDSIRKLLDIGGDKAIATVKAIVSTLAGGLEGNASPQAVLTALENLHDSMRANDAAVDAAADVKFGSER